MTKTLLYFSVFFLIIILAIYIHITHYFRLKKLEEKVNKIQDDIIKDLPQLIKEVLESPDTNIEIVY
jgi:hypothetical protein